MADHRVTKPPKWRTLPDLALIKVVIDKIWNWVDFYEDYASCRRQLAELTPGQRAILATGWCEAEVNNGGFWQFFVNSSGMLGPEALEGFRLVGMPKRADMLARAIALAGFDPYPRERAERAGRMPEDEDDLDPQWEKIGDTFFEVEQDQDARLAAYIRAHPEEFFLP